MIFNQMIKLGKNFLRVNPFLLIIIILSGLGMFAKLGDTELQPLGSAAHAAISREILRTGDWLTLHWQNCPEFSDFYQFPPLFFWLQAITFKLFGTNDISAKLVSAFFGFLTIVLTYFLGKLFLDEYGGFLSALTLILTPYFFRNSRKCELETIMIFFLTLGFYFFALSEKKNNPRWLILVGVASGFGLLTKGPPVVAIWASIFVYYLITRQNQKIFNLYLGIGLLLTLLIPLGWIIPQLIYKGQALYQKYFINQIWWSIQGRSVRRNLWQQAENYLFFFGAFFTYYLPWSVTGIFGIVKIFREKLNPFLILVIWVAVVWGGFTLAGYKDDYYLLAFWPGWAIINGLTFRHWLSKSEKNVKAIFTVATAVFILIVFFTPVKFDRVRNPEFKKIGPIIKSLTPPEEKIITYRMFYYDLVALLGWYADRGVEKSSQPNPRVPADARAWKEHSIETPLELNDLIENSSRRFLLIQKKDYWELPESIQKKIFPLFQEGRFIFALTQPVPASNSNNKK